MLRPLRTALRFLTRLPIPGDHALRPGELAASVGWYPLVGLVVGGLLALASFLPVPPLAGAALLAVFAPLITGSMHEDALADTFDGLGGGRDRVRALEIMKDSRVGAFGGLALAGALVLRVGVLASVAPGAWVPALITAHVAARMAAPPLLLWLPSARSEGLAAPLIAELRVPHVVAALVSGAALLALVGGPGALCLLGIVALVVWVMGTWFRRRVGGITGDLAGAAILVTELLSLLAWAWAWAVPVA